MSYNLKVLQEIGGEPFSSRYTVTEKFPVITGESFSWDLVNGGRLVMDPRFIRTLEYVPVASQTTATAANVSVTYSGVPVATAFKTGPDVLWESSNG